MRLPNGGFAEINLNYGCSSRRVKQVEFSAVLMTKLVLVVDMVRAMNDAVRVPITVKCRIAVDDMDPKAGLPLIHRADLESWQNSVSG